MTDEERCISEFNTFFNKVQKRMDFHIKEADRKYMFSGWQACWKLCGGMK